MERGDGTDGVQGLPPCPVCGTILDLNLVEVEGEADSEGEPLLLLDCPRGDFHATLTYGDVVSFITAEVTAKLTPGRQHLTP